MLISTLQALAQEEVLVIATTGGKAPEELSFPVPSNARIERFIPFAPLLPHVDVMVTNGGFNRVPLVAAGRTEDKAEVCARIECAGVGINLKTRTPAPEQIRKAVQ